MPHSFLPGSQVPADWIVTGELHWIWLDAPGGRWKTYSGPGGAKLAYPRLDSTAPASAHHGYGRPRLRDTHPFEIVDLADRLVLHGNTRRGIAHGDETLRCTVRNHVRQGFELLHDDGCLPWAAFARGAQPPPAWWLDERFERGIALWRAQAIEHNTLTPELLEVQRLCRAADPHPTRGERTHEIAVREREERRRFRTLAARRAQLS